MSEMKDKAKHAKQKIAAAAKKASDRATEKALTQSREGANSGAKIAGGGKRS